MPWNSSSPRDAHLIYLHDAERAVASRYDLGGMPSLVLIDRKGVLRYRHDGYTEDDARADRGGSPETDGGAMMASDSWPPA